MHFKQPTTLYHPVEGKRVFPAGEQHPGAAWSVSPDGDPPSASEDELKAQLAEAKERADMLERQVARRDQGMADVEGRNDALRAENAALKAEIRDLTKERDEALKTAIEVTRERDRHIATVNKLQGQIAREPEKAAA